MVLLQMCVALIVLVMVRRGAARWHDVAVRAKGFTLTLPVDAVPLDVPLSLFFSLSRERRVHVRPVWAKSKLAFLSPKLGDSHGSSPSDWPVKWRRNHTLQYSPRRHTCVGPPTQPPPTAYEATIPPSRAPHPRRAAAAVPAPLPVWRIRVRACVSDPHQLPRALLRRALGTRGERCIHTTRVGKPNKHTHEGSP